jgi:sugar phosphate permease
MTSLSFSQGSTWPALHMLAASWFPPLQRSGFISCYSGTHNQTHGCCFHSTASTVSLTAAAVSVRPKYRPLHGFQSSWEKDYDKTFRITSCTIFKF